MLSSSSSSSSLLNNIEHTCEIPLPIYVNTLYIPSKKSLNDILKKHRAVIKVINISKIRVAIFPIKLTNNVAIIAPSNPEIFVPSTPALYVSEINFIGLSKSVVLLSINE